MNTIRFLLLLVFLMVVVNGCGDKEVLEYRIWHTELDQEASKFLEELAENVEGWAAQSPQFQDYQVRVVVTALPWGDVATYLFQNNNNPPDLTHLEPFMMGQVLQEFSDPKEHHLYPMDALLEELVKVNGPISPSVAELQKYSVSNSREDVTYGLAYAVGTTYVAYRNDWMSGAGVEELPLTWSELVDFADELATTASSDGAQVSPFILPGRSPFFIAQLVGEMVVSMGGSLYEEARPDLQSDEMKAALWVLQDMIVRCDFDKYLKTTYRDQFSMFAEGFGAVVPVTYGRATKQINDTIEATVGSGDKNAVQKLRENFCVMTQPGKSKDIKGVATIDAEPWALFSFPEGHPEQLLRLAIGEEFLKVFYSQEKYIEFCNKVPVHLQPVFTDMFNSYKTQSAQVDWSHWLDVSRGSLENRGRTAPILMDPNGGNSKKVQFALSLQRSDLLADMVLDAVTPVKDLILDSDANEVESRRNKAIEDAVDRAQSRAMRLYEGGK